MKGYYYIGDSASVNPNDLKPGPRIMYVKESPLYRIEYTEFDGPYDSVNQLRKRSTRFKELLKNDPARAAQIQIKKNIIRFVNDKFVATEVDKIFSFDFMRTFQHVSHGHIKSNQLYGVHYFDPDSMRIKTVIHDRDRNGVWEAIVEVFDKGRNEWFEKRSTFFPADWSYNKLFHECDYAVQNMVKKEDSGYKYESRTLSGVPVTIVMKGEQLTSIYPLYQQ